MADHTVRVASETREPQPAAPALQYRQCEWGDLIEGTKAQIQALGIGVGLAFPGEPGGPSKRLRTTDPRGNPASVTPGLSGRPPFSVAIHFAGWPEMPCMWREWIAAAPDLMTSRTPSSDLFRGTAAALVAAGIVGAGQFPGMPGMRRVRVTILADGTALGGPPTANDPRAKLPGARTIERAGLSAYLVSVRVSDDEWHRRSEEGRMADGRWRAEVARLPRPVRLQPVRGAHLRLVHTARAPA